MYQKQFTDLSKNHETFLTYFQLWILLLSYQKNLELLWYVPVFYKKTVDVKTF